MPSDVNTYLTKSTDLEAVATAIRSKTGGTGGLAFPDGFVDAINGIEVGSGGDASVNQALLDSIINGSVTEVRSDTAKKVRSHMFSYCRSLTSVNFPAATSIESYAFSYCSSLATVRFPLVKTLVNNAFDNCSNLITADFSAVVDIWSSVFNACSSLSQLILRSETVAAGTGDMFTSTPIASGSGYIYVPSVLVETYKSASIWSTYANQFRALEDYTVDGTITGALDPEKTGQTI